MENKISGEQKGFLIPFAAILFAVLAIYVGVLAVNAVKANKYIGRDYTSIDTITVSGTGDVYASPDLATMDFSVVSEATAVAAAMDDNTKKMNAIVDVVKSLGVPEADLQTSGFSINPHYDYVNDKTTTSPNGAYYPSGNRVLSGYDITQTLTVKVRQDNMAKIGQIIAEATASGANQVGDLQFTIDKPETLQDEARKQAIDEAKAKAETLASQLGVKLVKITNYSEGGYAPTYSLSYDKAAATGTAAEAATPAIQTGQNKIESNVNITYEIE